MNDLDCLEWSLYNLKRFKKNRNQYFMSIFIISFFLMLFLSFSGMIRNMYQQLICNAISTNNISVFLNLDKNGRVIEDNAYKLLDELNKNENITNGPCYAQMELEAAGGNICSIDIEYITCQIDENTYYGKNDYSYDFINEMRLADKENQDLYAVEFSMDILDVDSCLFTSNAMKEYIYEYEKDSIFLYGRTLENENEIVISDYMLEKFGIYGDYENLINSEISFYVRNKPIIEKCMIVGVIDSDFFRVDSNCTRSQIIIGGNSNVYKRYGVYCLGQEMGLGEFADSINIINSIDEKYESLYNVPINIYTFQMIDKFKILCEKFICLFVGIILLAMFIKLVCNIYINMKNHSCYLGMLKAMGMENKHILKIYLYEMAILLVICTMLAAVLTSISLGILCLAMTNYLGYEIILTFNIFIKGVLGTGFSVGVVLMGISFVMNKILLDKEIILILKG